MLSKNFFYINKKAFFSIYYKWLFVYFHYFIFLTIFRIFTPNIDKIKQLCSKSEIYSYFISANHIKSIFVSKFSYFAASNLVLCSNTLFKITLLNEIFNNFPGLFVSAFLFNKSFLNYYSFTLADFFNILSTSSTDNRIFFEIFAFFYSNIFLLLGHFSLKSPQITTENDVVLLENLINPK